MKVSGTPLALSEGLQERLIESKLHLRKVARIADAIYDALYDLFETWNIHDEFTYYLEESNQIVKRHNEDTSWVHLPFHLQMNNDGELSADESVDYTGGDYESYREAAAYFREEYGRALAEEKPDWNEVLTCLYSFSENICRLLQVLEAEPCQHIPGVRTMLDTVIFVNTKQ